MSSTHPQHQSRWPADTNSRSVLQPQEIGLLVQQLHQRPGIPEATLFEPHRCASLIPRPSPPVAYPTSSSNVSQTSVACMVSPVRSYDAERQIQHKDSPSRLHQERVGTANGGNKIRTATRKAIADGRRAIVEGPIGRGAADLCLALDLVDVKSMPDKALIGIDGDDFHSRDSYITIHHQATDYARKYVPRGGRLEFQGPSCYSMPSRAGKPEDAYMDLLDPDPDIMAAHPQQIPKAATAPAILQTHKVSMMEPQGVDISADLNRPDPHHTILRPGPRLKTISKYDLPQKVRDRSDVQVPSRETQRGATYNGVEQHKLADSRQCHTYSGSSRADATLLLTGEASQRDPDTDTERELRHVHDIKIKSGPAYESTEEERIKYPSLDSEGLGRKRESNERRRTAVFGMSGAVAARLKAIGEHDTDKTQAIKRTSHIPTRVLIVSPPGLQQPAVKSKPLNPQARTYHHGGQHAQQVDLRQRQVRNLNPEATTYHAPEQCASRVLVPPPVDPQAGIFQPEIPERLKPGHRAVQFNAQAQTFEPKQSSVRPSPPIAERSRSRYVRERAKERAKETQVGPVKYVKNPHITDPAREQPRKMTMAEKRVLGQEMEARKIEQIRRMPSWRRSAQGEGGLVADESR